MPALSSSSPRRPGSSNPATASLMLTSMSERQPPSASNALALDKDPRESGPKEEYLCPICGEWWVADFPYYHWADDGRGVRYLRRYETMLHGRPLNGLP